MNFDIKKLRAFCEQHRRNAVFLRMNESAEPGRTRIGGLPLLPKDFAYPQFTDPEDGVTRPLSFLAQIDLAEIAPLDREHQLPDHGVLSFFYELENQPWGYSPSHLGCARVYWFEDADALTETPLPDTLDPAFVIPALAVETGAFDDYPDFTEGGEHFGLDAVLPDTDKAYDQYQAMRTAEFADETRTKLLGYADIVQDDMLYQCEYIARGYSLADGLPEIPESEQPDIAAHETDWVLLFQLDSVDTEDFELMFGDCGRIYFYIRKDDLAARRFDRVHLILQCY